MSKIRRGGHSAEGEPLSAGRVEYLEAARARVRTRRIRRTVIIVAVLTILVLFATGAVGCLCPSGRCWQSGRPFPMCPPG